MAFQFSTREWGMHPRYLTPQWGAVLVGPSAGVSRKAQNAERSAITTRTGLSSGVQVAGWVNSVDVQIIFLRCAEGRKVLSHRLKVACSEREPDRFGMDLRCKRLIELGQKQFHDKPSW